ncbi:hypothetical protein ZIOFF_066219 [Zingiber officinale]|uniref:Uncharacterized protein n=2 Tax=Zingiber officinale TaxID=94328 RepID=A0A8J5K7J7_ZINOF|nr:hypothetical protein ZIOFF_066219 [Zingiber officinale]
MVSIAVRVYDPEKDLSATEAVDRLCDGGATGQVSLYMDLLGDPASRFRHSPAYRMLVAETSGPVKEIVGVVRGSVKVVGCGRKMARQGGMWKKGHAPAEARPIYTKVGYILGLRVLPSHR